jgi:NADH-quinone oxidoreductase subunit M
MTGFPLLSSIIWLPALGALLLAVLPTGRTVLYRSVALLTTLLTFALTVLLASLFVSGAAPAADPALPLRFVEQVPWVAGWGISYFLGVDGLNLWLIVLTALLALVAVLSTNTRNTAQPRMLLALLLALQSATLGVFAAQDMLLFYIFFEATLVPIALLVGMFGGERRVYAATKLFIYTFAGSLLMLLGIVGLYVLHRNAVGGTGTFSLWQIASDIQNGSFALDTTSGRLLFGAFFAAFAVKLALFPFHSWLPDAYAEAPTPGAILLAGAMSKMGTYGFIRYGLLLFPEAARWAAPAIGLLAVIGVIYGGLAAFAQNDTRRVIGYSSISHMNMVALGIFALNVEGIGGATFQMISHGLIISALFLVTAALYERYNTYSLTALSGLWRTMPVYGGLTLLAVLGSLGLPGLMSFVGEFLILQGVYLSPELGWPYALGAVVGVILAAAYMLRLFRMVYTGPFAAPGGVAAPDLSIRERLGMALLLVPVVVGGVVPGLFLGALQSGAETVARFLGPALGG